jgi:hypothetical protein
MVSKKTKRLVVMCSFALLTCLGILSTEAQAGLPTCGDSECVSASLCYSNGKCLDNQVCISGTWGGSC